MAIKEIHVENIGGVRFQKRRGTSSVRIHIQGHNVKVTMPHWISYNQAVNFVKSRKDWIQKNRTSKDLLVSGLLLGKTYQLVINHDLTKRPRTRVLANTIRITLPKTMQVDDPIAQTVIEKACERALTKEANMLLAPRIQDLAFEHGFDYRSLHFKKLKRRWGSCDSHKNIVLNIFLTQLPWKYIDYVLVHELTHTEHLHHGIDFWQKLEECLPSAKQVRKELKQFHPQLMPR